MISFFSFSPCYRCYFAYIGAFVDCLRWVAFGFDVSVKKK